MRISIVFTDLDGSLLDLDGRISSEAHASLRRLAELGVPVCPLTSKTVAEVAPLLGKLPMSSAGFENGAGILFPGGSTQLFDRAVPTRALRRVAEDIRAKTGAPLRTLWELTDEELHRLTGLPLVNLPAVRNRLATAPLLVEEKWDQVLTDALPWERGLTLIRGNRFLHLQGSHDKGMAVARLLTAITRPPGAIVAVGDSENDIPMLAVADIRIVIPSDRGPHPMLIERFPAAAVAPFPHSKGWAAALALLLDGKMDYEERDPA